jgi:transposase-like protein
MRRRYSEEQRLRLIELVRSGRPTVVVAAEHGVTLSTAYNWVRRAGTAIEGRPRRRSHTAKAQLPGEPTFVRVVRRAEVGATIAVRVGVAEIQVSHEFDGELLRAVVEALGGGAG